MLPPRVHCGARCPPLCQAGNGSEAALHYPGGPDSCHAATQGLVPARCAVVFGVVWLDLQRVCVDPAGCLLPCRAAFGLQVFSRPARERVLCSKCPRLWLAVLMHPFTIPTWHLGSNGSGSCWLIASVLAGRHMAEVTNSVCMESEPK